MTPSRTFESSISSIGLRDRKRDAGHDEADKVADGENRAELGRHKAGSDDRDDESQTAQRKRGRAKPETERQERDGHARRKEHSWRKWRKQFRRFAHYGHDGHQAGGGP